jgi:hypothetical protein
MDTDQGDIKMRIPWRLYDPAEDEEYLMPVNPNSDTSSVGVQKSTGYSTLVGSYFSDTAENPGSYYNVNIVYERPDEIKKFNFSGIIYNSNEYYQLLYWANKQNFFELTDDIDRTFEIYITSFKIERLRSRRFPWKHKYDMEASVRSK